MAAAGQVIRNLASGAVTVAAYVSHFVAKYDQKTVAGFASKLYGDDGGDAALDYFYTTDSIPRVIGWLNAELSTRATKKAEVRERWPAPPPPPPPPPPLPHLRARREWAWSRCRCTRTRTSSTHPHGCQAQFHPLGS